MNGSAIKIAIACALAGVTSVARADGPEVRTLAFQLVQSHGMSPDGSTIVGAYVIDPFQPSRALRWRRPDVLDQFLPSFAGASAVADAASSDGSVLGGVSSQTFPCCSFVGTLWDEAGAASGIAGGAVADLSPDGTIAVGRQLTAGPPGSLEAYVWTSRTGTVPLGDLPGGMTSSGAAAVSADGGVIVGHGTGDEERAVRWTHDGSAWSLDELPLPDGASAALDVSADGDVIVGWHGTAARRAYRLAGGTVTDLGEGVANFVSADGLTVVGHSDVNGAPWIWDEASGRRAWMEYVEGHGLDLTGWTTVEVRGMSSGARAFTGVTTSGVQLSFGLWLDRASCAADLDGDGVVSSTDLLLLLDAFGTPDADLDDDGTTDFADLLLLLVAWGACA
jgi:hypothetical protein